MSRLKSSLGWGPRPGETRRDFLARLAGTGGYVPRAVYDELVELHDRVVQLEREIKDLKAR
jgi:cell division protein FtsB